jgi:hypothetical protein
MLSTVILMASMASAGDEETAVSLYESSAEVVPQGKIDELVLAKLSSLDIQPVLCSDAVFVRRAYLDLTGTIPTPEEAKAFIEDQDTKNKRIALVERLLERPEHADYWAMKWGDILRIKAEFPVNLWPNAAQAYHRWIKTSIAQNKPYDEFARELLTSSGSNFRVGPVNFYRAIQNKTPEGIATAVALTFMGSRADFWPKERLAGMAVFFSQVGYKPTSEWKEETVFWDPLGSSAVASSVAPGQAAVAKSLEVTNVVPKDLAETAKEAAEKPKDEAEKPKKPAEKRANTKPATPVFPDGTKTKLPPDRDPRKVFADWLLQPENPWFAKAIVNRTWSWVMGRGIIHEPDDIREGNPPSNPELLAYLEKELVSSGYDLKHLKRLMFTSTTYQFSSMPRFNSPEATANFASYPIRRLEAEVLIDAVNKITGTTDLYTSPIPEPFTYIPKDMPAVAVADGSITSSFLTLFGRSARATGMENERVNKLSSSQWLHMLNSGHIQAKLEQGPKLREIFASRRPPAEIVEELYLTILSRQPTDQEVKNLLEYTKPVAVDRSKRVSQAAARAAYLKRRNDSIDIVWSLINSTEFLHRH